MRSIPIRKRPGYQRFFPSGRRRCFKVDSRPTGRHIFGLQAEATRLDRNRKPRMKSFRTTWHRKRDSLCYRQPNKKNQAMSVYELLTFSDELGKILYPEYLGKVAQLRFFKVCVWGGGELLHAGLR